MDDVVIRLGRQREAQWVQVYHELTDLYAPYIGGFEGIGYWTYLRRYINRQDGHPWEGRAFPTDVKIRRDGQVGGVKLRRLRALLVAWGLLDVEVVQQPRYVAGRMVGSTRRYVYRLNDPLTGEQFRASVAQGLLPRAVNDDNLPQAPSDALHRGTRPDGRVPTSPGSRVRTRPSGRGKREIPPPPEGEKNNNNTPAPAVEPAGAVVVAAPSPSPGLVDRLVAAGVTRAVAERLVDEYPEQRIERQIEYLHHRRADDSAAVLVAAIREDWAPPAAMAAAQARAVAEAAERERQAAEANERAEETRRAEVFRRLPAEVQAIWLDRAERTLPDLIRGRAGADRVAEARAVGIWTEAGMPGAETHPDTG